MAITHGMACVHADPVRASDVVVRSSSETVSDPSVSVCVIKWIRWRFSGKKMSGDVRSSVESEAERNDAT